MNYRGSQHGRAGALPSLWKRYLNAAGAPAERCQKGQWRGPPPHGNRCQGPGPLIIEGYILSDKLVDYRKEMDLDTEAGASSEDPYAFLRALPAGIVDPLLKSDASYIEAALDEARVRHGSVLGFIKAEYDVSDDEIAALRRHLLER